MKGRIKGQDEPADQGFSEQQEAPQYKINQRIDQQINDYIQNNPKQWDYIQQLPRERLERTLVLERVQQLQHKQKMDQRMAQEIKNNPELNPIYERLVRDLPEERRESMKMIIARSLKFAQKQTQKPPSLKMVA